MEDLLKQVRSIISGKEEFGNARVQRTSSFRGERKPQKWLKRQLSRQMSFKEPTEEIEYAAAVAAAAFAITSLESEGSHITDQRKPEVGHQFSLPRIISGIVDRIAAAAATEPDEAQERNPYEHQAEAEKMIPEKTIHPVPSIKRSPNKRLTFADEQQEDTGKPFSYIQETPAFEKQQPDYANSFTGRSPSVKRTPTFDQEQMQTGKTTRRESSAPRPSTIPPPPAVPPLYILPKREQGRRRGKTDTDADTWERERMAKIKERYEKLNATILEWEDKKKKKARRKLETAESNREKRKSKALQNYQIEMERIKQIADGARAQAKEKRRNEELKLKEKANKYRETGEPPRSSMCLCL